MRKTWNRIWNAEPVRVAGAITTGWAAAVAADQADPSWYIPTWTYVAAAIVIPVFTALVRDRVTPWSPTDDDPAPVA